MVDLKATSPLEGAVPKQAGGVFLREAAPQFITAILPQKGAEKDLSAALKSAHGMALPGVGKTSGKAALRCLWAGRATYFLVGETAADPALSKCAALVDQSDAWAVMSLEGAAATEVLARLCPLDLRDSQFKRGQTARSEVAHMMAVITRTTRGFEIMVMRSFARTAAHHIDEAMKSVAATDKVT